MISQAIFVGEIIIGDIPLRIIRTASSPHHLLLLHLRVGGFVLQAPQQRAGGRDPPPPPRRPKWDRRARLGIRRADAGQPPERVL